MKLRKSKHELENVVRLLASREINLSKKSLRKTYQHISYSNYKILRQLILEETTTFRVVKRVQSRGCGIYYEQRRLFKNSFTASLPSFTDEHNLAGRWKLDPKDALKEGVLFLMAPPNQIRLDTQGLAHNKNSIVGLTKRNSSIGAQRLLLVHFYDGQIWQEMKLPKCGIPGQSRFWQELDWNKDQESLFLRSAHRSPNLRTTLSDDEDDILSSNALFGARNGNGDQQDETNADFLVALLVCDVHPLKPVALFEIRKSVFGGHTTLASLNNDCLITLHRSSIIRLRSLPDLIQLNPHIKLSGSIDNLQEEELHPITNLSPVLFQVKSEDFFLELGGFPWHALIQANAKKSPSYPGAKGKFSLLNCENETITGVFGSASDTLLLDPETATFRDDSGHIVLLGHDRLQAFRIQDVDGSMTLSTVYTLTKDGLTKDSFPSETISETSKVVMTKSGRRVKARKVLDLDDLRAEFYCAGFEDDLDLAFVVHVDRGRGIEDGSDGLASVWLFDDATGEILKIIPLGVNWDDDATILTNQVELDLETMVHSIKRQNGSCECVVYELDRRKPEEKPELKSKVKRKKWMNKSR